MCDDNLPGPHNRFFFQTFSQLDRARDLIAGFLPGDVLAEIDLASLRLVSGSYIDDQLRLSQSDLLYEVDQVGDSGSAALVYVLFEHKSVQDRLTPFQMLKYMVRIWETRLRDGESLCPVIPMLLYHGENQWKTARTMNDLLRPAGSLARFTPDFDIEILDLSQQTDESLRERANLKAFLLLLKYIRRGDLAEKLPEILTLFATIGRQPSGLDCLKTVLIYLSSGTDQINRNQLIEAVQNTLQEQGEDLMPTIAQQWKQEGREEGRLAGQVQLLQRLLGVPESTLEQLLSKPLARLEQDVQRLQKDLDQRPRE
ncbi:putative transposase [Rubripirellula obstinata]|uniref:Putative transposase n=1 Tax=Rubripirellula obstinata TaxID=406547 RepID=A0A5B1CRF2_9BACT|nr:Rpn family recombination-promoting nuclease/putative transposase [Rubripirellula obstinata]KAA1262449.1 putative transposase [Rubripirellula obstinata]